MAHKKPNLPTKTCAHCARPFAWRKKWARDWENVRYCSDACREGRFTPAAPSAPSRRRTAAPSRH
ncbi:MAG: DUF2256 domain-containing protein [Alphaproteobacteria bacterium]|nr:DUF2256 domain-containing protein [Alphaproteobacteria bacterium]